MHFKYYLMFDEFGSFYELKILNYTLSVVIGSLHPLKTL